jgi:hypothetical protein
LTYSSFYKSFYAGGGTAMSSNYPDIAYTIGALK